MEIDTVVEKNGDVDGGSNFYFSSERKIVSDKLVEALNGKSGLASLSNRQEYEKRLLTFQASTYYAKPPCLSPIFCARFG
jgi:acetate kinase